MGTRQLSQVIGTIQNMPRIDKLTGIANNSNGAAMEAQLVWAESLEAKLQGLTNASQIFWQTFVNSDGAKGFIDMLTEVVNGATALTETFGSVGVSAGLLMAVFMTFTKNPLTNSFKNLSMVMVGKLIPGFQATTNTMLLTNGATATATGGFTIFSVALNKTTITAIATKFAVAGLQMVLTMGLSVAIMAVVGVISKFVSSLTGSTDKLREFNNEVTENTGKLGTQVEETEKLYERMIQLEDELANSANGDLNTDKVRELAEIQARIAEILPETASGYNAEGKAIATSTEEIARMIQLKKDEIELNARKFVDENAGLETQIKGYAELHNKYETYKKALQSGGKVTEKYLANNGNGQMIEKSIDIKVKNEDVQKAKQELEDLALKIKAAKVMASELAKQDFTNGQISEILGFDIELLDTYDDALQQATDSTEGLGESSQQAGDGLESIVVKLGNVTANAADAAGKIKELGSTFSELGGKIDLGQKALEEFNKHGGLTAETKEKILNSGDSKLISFLADETTMAKNLNEYIKENKKLRDETEQAAIANAVADQEGQKYMAEKNAAAAEQNAKLDEQKGKIDEINKATAEQKEAEPPDYSADITAKTTAEQQKTTVTNEESDKRKTKLKEESEVEYKDVENKTTGEQLKTNALIDQINARIAEGQRETTENQASYTTDGTNFKTNETTKTTDTQTTMTTIGTIISGGMSGLSTHYNTNASNFATSLTSMEGSARTSVANINSILASIKPPTISMPSIPSGGGMGGATQSTQSLEPPTRMVDNFKNAMFEATSSVGRMGNKPITEKLPTTLNPSILNVKGESEEDKRRQAQQIASAVGEEVGEVLPRAMRLVLPVGIASATARKVITIKPGNIVPTVNPNKKPSKKPSKGSGSSSSKKPSKGSSSSSKKPEKVDIKDIEDEIDRYKALKDHLSDINHYLAMNNKYREHAKGKDKYKWHYEEIKLLEQKKKAIESVQKEQKKEMVELEKKLKANGFNPKNGDMSNYKARLEQLKKEVNAMSNSNKAKEAAIKKYEDLKKAADRYFEVSDDLQKHQEDWYDTANAIKDAQIAMEEEAASEVEKIRDRLVEALKNKYEEMREGEISDLDKEIERLQKQLEDLDKKSDDKKGRLAKLQAERDKWAKDDSAYGKAKVEELNKQIEELEREIQKDEIQASIDELEKEKDKVDEHYDELLSDKNIYAEANKLLSTKSQKELLDMLTKYAPDYANIGELWGKSFADNFKKELEEAKNALDFLNGKLKPKDPPKPTTPPKPPTGGGGSKPPVNTPVKKGDKIKVTNKGATVYSSATTNKSSGNWGKTMQLVGRSDFKIANISGNRAALSPNGKFPATGWIDKKYIAKFHKGGLTGLWNDMNGKKGKLAELHSGEAILNKDQSKLFYNNGTAKAFENFVKLIPDLSNMFNKMILGNDENIEQNIHIENNITINGKADTFDMKREAESFTEIMLNGMKKEGIIKRRR
ncbi:MAG: hypothetical protein ACRCX8_08550 [Sarcina sp.]